MTPLPPDRPFGLKAHDWYCIFKKNYDEWRGEPTSYRKAINCAVTAYHLREWVWEDILKANPQNQVLWFGTRTTFNQKQYQARVLSDCPDFRIVRDICNASKHTTVTLYTPDVVATRRKPGAGLGDFVLGASGLGTAPHLEVRLRNGTTRRMSDVFASVAQIWDGKFVGQTCP